MSSQAEAIVEVDDLTIDFWDRDHWVNVVNHVSFDIKRGETLGLVGESGCGKSTTAFSLFGYRRPGSRVRAGAIRFEGRDLLRIKERGLRSIRGEKICLVPQNPAGSLTPSMRVGTQVVETLKAHRVSTGREAEQRTVDLFAQVGLPEPGSIVERYPHELSGGQQQRVVTAIALACSPSLLVLDEPTTALDVTTQARILKLLARIQRELGTSMLYVTHNLGVVAQICDRVAVMYAGELVEIAPTAELFENPRHPYTRGLIAAVPRISAPPGEEATLRGLLRREELPEGCRFAPRCDYAQAECFTRVQSLDPVRVDHHVACWLWESIPTARRPSEGRPARPSPVPR